MSRPSRDGAVLVEALELIVKQYPSPDITHKDYRVNACRLAEAALAAHKMDRKARNLIGFCGDPYVHDCGRKDCPLSDSYVKGAQP